MRHSVITVSHQTEYIKSLAMAALTMLVALSCNAQTVRRWDFDKSAEQDTWTGPGITGAGLLWMTRQNVLAGRKDASTGDYAAAVVERSPSNLGIPAAEVTQIRLR